MLEYRIVDHRHVEHGCRQVFTVLEHRIVDHRIVDHRIVNHRIVNDRNIEQGLFTVLEHRLRRVHRIIVGTGMRRGIQGPTIRGSSSHGVQRVRTLRAQRIVTHHTSCPHGLSSREHGQERRQILYLDLARGHVVFLGESRHGKPRRIVVQLLKHLFDLHSAIEGNTDHGATITELPVARRPHDDARSELQGGVEAPKIALRYLCDVLLEGHARFQEPDFEPSRCQQFAGQRHRGGSRRSLPGRCRGQRIALERVNAVSDSPEHRGCIISAALLGLGAFGFLRSLCH